MEHSHHSWDEKQQVTLQDVAKAAGVSSSAASVILNGARSGTRVSESTRKTVLEAAGRMGYRANGIARSLSTGKSHRIGVYSGRSRLDSRNSFFAEVLGGVFDAAGECGFNTVVHTSGSHPSELVDLIASRSIDGLVVHASSDDPILPLLGDLRIPAVAIADRIESLPSIVVDESAGGILMAQHLATRGHRHILVKQAPYPSPSAVVRVSAFLDAAARLGVKTTVRLETFEEDDGMGPEDLRLVTEGPDRATVVFGWSDGVAFRVCMKLTALGIQIPGEVAVAGFDGIERGPLFQYDLTTIAAPWSKLASQAVKLLLELAGGSSVPNLTTLPVEFVRGATT